MADNLLGDTAVSLTEISRLVSSGVVLVDEEGQPVWVDEEAADMFGLQAAGEEVCELPAMFTEDGERLSPTVCPYMRVFDTGEPIRGLCLRAELADGRGPILVDAVPLTDESGLSHAALSIDVVGEGDEPQTLEFYDPDVGMTEVFERVDEAFFALDEDWQFTYVNEQAESVLDRSREELLGRTVWAAFPEAIGTAFQDSYERAVEAQESVTFEEFYPPLDSWFEVTAYPSETGLSVYFQDITERKERERELEQYEAIFESIDDGVYVVDDAGRFTMVNDAYADLTGYSRAELVGEPTTKVVDEETVEEATAIRDRLSDDDTDSARLEAELTTADGDTVAAEAAFALADQIDGPTRRIGVVRDISERKARERELATRSRQQRAVADLGRQALTEPNLDEFFAEAASTVAEVLDNDYCKILDLDTDADELLLRQGVGWDPGYVGAATVSASEAKSQAAYTLGQEEPVVVENLADDDRIDGPDLLTDHDVTSGISVIIGTIDSPWGILGTHDTDRKSFSDHDIDFVQSVANLVASVIRNRNKTETLEEVADTFRTANAMTIRDASLEERVSDLLSLGRDFLDADVGFLTRREGETQTLDLVSGDVDHVTEGERFPFDQAYYKTDSAADGLVAVPDVEQAGLATDPELDSWAGAYVGHAIAGDASFGSIGFVSTDTREEGFDAIELVFIKQIARWVRHESARQQREAELAESRARYQALVDNFPNGAVTLFDEDCRYTIAGGNIPTSLDMSVDALAGHRPDEILPDALAAQLLPNYEATLDGESRSFLVEHDGEIRKVHTVPIRGPDGAVRSGMSISQDVTQRRERERKLQEQRQRVGVLNAINSLIQDVSESVVRQSDPTAIQSVVREQLQESEFYDAVWVGEVGPERETIQHALDAAADAVPAALPLHIRDAPDSASPVVQAVRDSEMQVATVSGQQGITDEERAFEAMAAIPLTFENTLHGVLTVYTERTDAFNSDERQALDRLGTIVAHALQARSRESQLRRSERLYRTLAENIPNGSMAMVDTDLRFRAIAGGLTDEPGTEPEDLYGKRPSDIEIIPQEAAQRLEDAFRTAFSGEATALTVEVESFVVELRVHPIWDEAGETVVNAMALSQDITERVEHERELERERERLEFLIRLVRHNLLNSLNLVTARLDMVEGRVDYEVSQHLDTAQRRAREMKDLVETIRDLTSAVVASEEHDLELVALDDVLDTQVESAAISYPDAEFELVSNPPVDIYADELLREALENVLDNAVQHNDKETPRVTVDVTTTDETVTVSIADNGPGIPDHLKKRIFEEGTQSVEDPGTGFGLHIVREVVDAYDGTIAVDDADGGGTVFELTFPKQAEH